MASMTTLTITTTLLLLALSIHPGKHCNREKKCNLLECTRSAVSCRPIVSKTTKMFPKQNQNQVYVLQVAMVRAE